MGVNLTAGTTPNTTFDVNGSIAFREGTALALSNGVNSNVALTNHTMFRITGPTAAFSITGFGSGVDGRMLTIINATTQTMTLTHQATSSAANQINTGGNNTVIAANGVATLVYNTTLSKWIVSGTIGDVPNLSGLSTGTNADDMVVVSGGVPARVAPGSFVETYAWGLDGNAGTTAGTNFLGTTDANDLVIKAGGTEGVRVKATTGYVGLNVNSPAVRFAVSNNATTASAPSDAIAQFTNPDNTDTEILIDTYGSGVNDDPAVVFRRATGTSAAPAALRTGDAMGRLSWWGHNGTTLYDQSAKFEVVAAENWTGTANGTNMDFWTTTNGTTLSSFRMRLSDTGNLGIGLSTVNARLDVQAANALSTGSVLKLRNSSVDSLLTLGNDGTFKHRLTSYDFGTDAGYFQTGYYLGSSKFRTFTPSYGRGFFGIESVLETGGTTASANYYGFRSNLVEQSTHSTALTDTYTGIFNFNKYGTGNYTFHQNLMSNIILRTGATGTITTADGVVGQLTMGGGSTNVTTGSILKANLGDWAAGYSGTISNLRGLYINYMGHSRVTNAYGIYIENVSGASTSNYAIYSNGGYAYFAGSLGLGTTSSTHKINVTGTAGLSTGTAWTNTSDRRVKHNIHPYKRGLKEILAIKPVYYTYNESLGYDHKGENIGIVAQELEPILPEAIMTAPITLKDSTVIKDGKHLYRADAIWFAMVNAVQEQQTQIEALKKELAEKTKAIEKLEAELAKKNKITEGVLSRLEKLEAALNPMNEKPKMGHSEKK